MLTCNSRRRWLEIIKHLLWLTVTVVIVTMIVPAFLNRGFNFKWFVAFLPDVAIMVAILILDDLIQLFMKTWMMAKT